MNFLKLNSRVTERLKSPWVVRFGAGVFGSSVEDPENWLGMQHWKDIFCFG